MRRVRVALSGEIVPALRLGHGAWNSGSVTVRRTTLSTFVDGSRTATALVIPGRSADRNPFTMNLVVIAQDGQIVSLR